MTGEKKFHRAWLVLAAAMLIYAGSMGVMMNSIGVLFSAIIEDRGFRAGDLSLFHTIRSLCMAFSMPFTTKLFFRQDHRLVMGGLVSAACVGLSLMCLYNELWQWYLSAVLVGVGTGYIMVVIPVIINNWFHKRNGLAMGLTMSASGVAGAIFSPLLSRLIVSFGWRQSAALMGVVSFLLIVPASILLLVPSPEKVGCQPYGDGEPGARKADDAASSGGVRQLPGYIFILGTAAIVLSGSLVNFNNQLPTFAKTVGYSISAGAMLTSCCMVGNLVGKLLYGALVDWLGVYRSAWIYVTMICGSMAGFLFLRGFFFTLCLSALLLGMAYSINTMTASLLFLDLYGGGAYREKLSRAQAVNNLTGAFLSAMMPYMYDIFGSFDVVFLYGMAGCCVSFATFLYLQRRARQTA